MAAEHGFGLGIFTGKVRRCLIICLFILFKTPSSALSNPYPIWIQPAFFIALSKSGVTSPTLIDAFQLICKTEGILIAFEPAFAVAHGIKLAKEMGKDKILVLNICGRGDKDIDTAEKMLGNSLDK